MGFCPLISNPWSHECRGPVKGIIKEHKFYLGVLLDLLTCQSGHITGGKPYFRTEILVVGGWGGLIIGILFTLKQREKLLVLSKYGRCGGVAAIEGWSKGGS